MCFITDCFLLTTQMHALLLNCGIFFSCIIFSLFSYPFRCLCTSSMQSSNKSSWKWIHVEYIEYVVICSNLFILEEGGKSLSIYHLPAKKLFSREFHCLLKSFLSMFATAQLLLGNPVTQQALTLSLWSLGLWKHTFLPPNYQVSFAHSEHFW